MAIRNLKAPAAAAGQPFPCGDSSRVLRWVARPESAGFRRVGFSDEIVRSLRHTGWYLTPDDWSGGTARGVVYRAPGGRGYVAGIWTSYDDGRGASLAICERPEESAEDAARYADQLAEWYAEAERGYQEAWSAGQTAGDDLRDTLSACRESVDRARMARGGARSELIRALASRGAAELPPDYAESARRRYRECLTRAREFLDSACEARRDAWARFRDAEPDRWNQPARAAFREGSGF